MPPLSQPPPQLSESVFRWCEPYITRAVNAWPEETRFAPEEMVKLDGYRVSPNTFAARMRDAVTSVIKYGWDTTINVPRLKEMTGLYSVSYAEDGSVWWKHRGRQGRPTNMTPLVRSQGFMVDAGVARAPWKDVTEDELRAVALLIDKQRIEGPFTITGLIPHETGQSLMAEFAVSVMWDHEKNFTTIS